jgi:hypothetical protein
VADLTQFEPGETKVETFGEEADDEMEDQLLELLRRGTALQQDEFLTELRHQRSPEEASV